MNGHPGNHTINASGEDLCCDKDKTQNSLLGRISAGITQTVNDVIQVKTDGDTLNTRQIRTFRLLTHHSLSKLQKISRLVQHL